MKEKVVFGKIGEKKMNGEKEKKKCFGMMDLQDVKCEKCNEETVIERYNKTFGFLSSDW